MKTVLLLFAGIMLLTSTASAQLPRIGSTISNDVKSYFGIARRIDNIDSMKVVKGAGITILAMRRNVVVDSVVFSPSEVPILERYLREYEQLLTSEKDLFINDTAMRRILGRVKPRQFFDTSVKAISVRLTTGTVLTGIPLAVSEDDLLLSNGTSFTPEVDVQKGTFTCVPASIIETMTGDVGVDSPEWYIVRGDVARFRTALVLSCPTRAYAAGLPPEASSCIDAIKDDLFDGAPLWQVCPRTTSWIFSGFGGFVSTVMDPTATVKRSLGGSTVTDTLRVQPTTYSFGAEAVYPVGALFDLGVRGMIQAQPSTVDDQSLQNSLGFDEYALQLIGTWHIIPIDVVGYNEIGLSTTLAVGPSLLNYRGRTYRTDVNLTTTGSGLAIDVAWSVQAMVSLSRSLSVGVRGIATYQHGLSASIDSITVEERFGKPWVATFEIPDQSAAFVGGHIVLTYALD
jgi:hypothetical protein